MTVRLDKSCTDCANFRAQAESIGECQIESRPEQRQKQVNFISCFFFVDRNAPR